MRDLPKVRALARVDVAAVERNCATLASALAGGTSLCAVVKADGYGHGVTECARAALAGGATWLAVATAQEALDLRDDFRSVPILVMGALSGDELDMALAAQAEIGIWCAEFLQAVAARAERVGVRPRIHIKHDSGMGRLGEADPKLVAEMARRCSTDERVELAGLWTHFATADEEGSDFFDVQLERFRELAGHARGHHPDLIVHAANSAATLRDPRSHFDMVRCGVAIYGLDPFGSDPSDHSLEPALELRSWVAAVKRFPAGTSAGYGRRWTAPHDTWVGVLPIGYADGVRRGLTNNADVLVRGRRFPVVGTVSMDNITIDLGPETDVKPGEQAILIGAQGEERILAEEVATRLGTINYEVTCGISARVPRSHYS
jgi:alanine racemase